MAAGYRVIAWEAPGYGLSKLPEKFDFDAVAKAGAALVRATGREKNVIFGHSMGGQITPPATVQAAVKAVQAYPEAEAVAMIRVLPGFLQKHVPA